MKPNIKQIKGFIRHLLTFGGGYLVANGKLSEADLQSIVGLVTTLTGAWFSYSSAEKKSSH